MKDNKDYIFPKVSDYIKDKDLCNIINDCEQQPFIILKNDNAINIIPLKEYSDILVYGIQKSGKSTFLENILINILLKTNPKETRLIIIDTKLLQYSNYNGVPHLLSPVTTDLKKGLATLQKIIVEIDKRYTLFSINRVKSIEEYNSIKDKEKLPSIIVMIDDLLDLMEYSKKEVTDILNIIMHKGRQAGIYLVASTSSIDRNFFGISFINHFSNRICFESRSERDSELLLNKKDAIKLNKYEYYFNSSINKYDGKYELYKIDESDINNLITYVVTEKNANYNYFEPPINDTQIISENDELDDELYNDVVEYVTQMGYVSASLLQRKFRLGFNRAARMIDLLEERGVVGPQNGSKPREVLINKEPTIEPPKEEIITPPKQSNKLIRIIEIVLILIFILYIISTIK